MGYDFQMVSLPPEAEAQANEHRRLLDEWYKTIECLKERVHAKRHLERADQIHKQALVGLTVRIGPQPDWKTDREGSSAWMEQLRKEPAWKVAQSIQHRIAANTHGHRLSRAASDAVDQTPDPGYFRLNIWGMGEYRDVMAAVGMMHWEGDHPKWPPSPTNEDEESSEWKAYEAAADAIRAYRPEGAAGIAGWKFGSNDGWHVTKEECAEAVAVWDALPDERKLRVKVMLSSETTDATVLTKVKTYWDQWIDYLRMGAQSDGFKVY